MPIRLSDTQKITNVPSSRDIGSLVNLDTSRDPGVNQPAPPLPRIQSGFSPKTDTFELIDRIDFSSSSPLINLTNVVFPLGNYRQYKLVFQDVDWTSSPSLNISFDNEAGATHYYEYQSNNGSSVGSSSTWTSTTSMLLGNSTSFSQGGGGVNGDVDIFAQSYSLTSSMSVPSGFKARWNLFNWTYRTNGHGLIYTGSTVYRGIMLRSTYGFVQGTLTLYGLPR